MSSKKHFAQVAGLFYPGDEESLRDTVKGYLDHAASSGGGEGRLKALIAPHAGYVYSGACAAKAYAQIQGESFDRVVVFGPTHRVYFKGFSIYAEGVFETPLGEIPIDEEFCSQLVHLKLPTQFFPAAYQQEHSIEVHLPFLQVALQNNFRLVPVLIGDVSAEMMEEFALALREILEEDGYKTLVVASTDFSHFLSAQKANDLDNRGRELIVQKDADALLEANHHNETSLCGIHPVYTLMKLYPEIRPEFLAYSHSGEVSGDHQSVVGYMAFRLCG